MVPIVNIRISKTGIITCDNTASGKPVFCDPVTVAVNPCDGCPVYDRLDDRGCLRSHDTSDKDVATAFDYRDYIFKARI